MFTYSKIEHNLYTRTIQVRALGGSEWSSKIEECSVLALDSLLAVRRTNWHTYGGFVSRNNEGPTFEWCLMGSLGVRSNKRGREKRRIKHEQYFLVERLTSMDLLVNKILVF